MTKYILHGGATGAPKESNKKFYQEWVKDFDDDFVPTILLVYFARPDEVWDELEKSDKERFSKHTNNRQVHFLVASTDMKKFKEQIKKSDVIYFRGGDPQKIVDIILEIKDEFLSLIKRKVYAGSSAGVMFLSEYSRARNIDWTKYLGLLKINSIVHYRPEIHDKSLEQFKEKNLNNYEFILIPESEFTIRRF